MDLKKKCCDQFSLIKGLRFLEEHVLWPSYRPITESVKPSPAWPAGPIDPSSSSKAKRPKLRAGHASLWSCKTRILILETTVCRAASLILAPCPSLWHPVSPLPPHLWAKPSPTAGGCPGRRSAPTKLLCFLNCIFYCWKLGEVCV